jgi:hypothetical protein
MSLLHHGLGMSWWACRHVTLLMVLLITNHGRGSSPADTTAMKTVGGVHDDDMCCSGWDLALRSLHKHMEELRATQSMIYICGITLPDGAVGTLARRNRYRLGSFW